MPSKSPKRLNSDIALEFVRRTFGSNSVSSSEVSPQNHPGIDPAVDDDVLEESAGHPHKCLFFFSNEGWSHLHEIGMAIGTTEPSQIIRRALATMWLVASGQYELIDKSTNKPTKIPD